MYATHSIFQNAKYCFFSENQPSILGYYPREKETFFFKFDLFPYLLCIQYIYTSTYISIQLHIWAMPISAQPDLISPWVSQAHGLLTQTPEWHCGTLLQWRGPRGSYCYTRVRPIWWAHVMVMHPRGIEGHPRGPPQGNRGATLLPS